MEWTSMKQLKNGFLILFLLLFSMCSFHQDEIPENNGGILLSFDDYHPITWAKHFNLFDKYNARVTFFVTRGYVTQFMLDAQERGHEIGFHSVTHPNLTRVTRDRFFEETILPINIFREQGVELTSFAYPFGAFEEWMHAELLEYYRIVCGRRGNYVLEREDLKFGFVGAKSIDNIAYRSEIIFRRSISRILRGAKISGNIVALYSHDISYSDWGITPDRLEFVLRKAKNLGLTFYTYKCLQ